METLFDQLCYLPAGARCPDLWVQRIDTGEPNRFHQLFRYGQYVLLAVGEETPGKWVQARNKKFAKAVRLRLLRASSIGVERVEEDDEDDEKGYRYDSWGCSYTKKGERFAALVRPDCYIELVGENEDVMKYSEKRIPRLFALDGHTNGSLNTLSCWIDMYTKFVVSL